MRSRYRQSPACTHNRSRYRLVRGLSGCLCGSHQLVLIEVIALIDSIPIVARLYGHNIISTLAPPNNRQDRLYYLWKFEISPKSPCMSQHWWRQRKSYSITFIDSVSDYFIADHYGNTDCLRCRLFLTLSRSLSFRPRSDRSIVSKNLPTDNGNICLYRMLGHFY